MFGARALDELRLQKEALLLESGLNRLKLQGQLEHLRALTRPVGRVAARVQGLSPLMMFLAPVAGFLAFRSLRRARSLAGRLISVVKLALPLYQSWKRLSLSL